MNMVSMKCKPRKKEEMGGTPIASDEQDKYPWGLRLSLGDEQLDALGIKELPKVNDTMTIMCAVTVVGTRASEQQGGGEERSVELQITDIGMEGKQSDAGEKLYGKKEA